MAKKQKKEELLSEVTAYVFDERSGTCLLQITYDNMPMKGDNIVICRDGYVFECLVTKRTFVVDSDSNNIAWNLFVVPIGTPYKIEQDEQEDKTKNDDNNEMLN